MGLRETMRELKRHVIVETLLECGGNITVAAKRLEVHRMGLGKMIKDLNINMSYIKQSKKIGHYIHPDEAHNADNHPVH